MHTIIKTELSSAKIFPQNLIELENSNDNQLLNLWLSRYHLATVAVGDTIGLFMAISNGANSIEQIANTLMLEQKGIEALTCLLASLNLLNKQFTKVRLTDTSRKFLLKDSSLYWGEVLSYTKDTLEYQVLLNSLQNSSIKKTTQQSTRGNSFSSMWRKGKFEKNSAKKFINIMNSTIFVPAMKAVQSNLFNNINHLLDIGGGSGCFASLFVSKYLTKKATIFEIPQVCEITKEYLKNWGTDNKITLQPGNFFKDKFPKNIDGILFSNILHDWPVNEVEFLINKAYNTLTYGGSILIHEILLNEEKNGPLNAATFNVFMYANYKSQQFTKTELFLLLKNAGFSLCNKHETHQDYSLVTAVKL